MWNPPNLPTLEPIPYSFGSNNSCLNGNCPNCRPTTFRPQIWEIESLIDNYNQMESGQRNCQNCETLKVEKQTVEESLKSTSLTLSKEREKTKRFVGCNAKLAHKIRSCKTIETDLESKVTKLEGDIKASKKERQKLEFQLKKVIPLKNEFNSVIDIINSKLGPAVSDGLTEELQRLSALVESIPGIPSAPQDLQNSAPPKTAVINTKERHRLNVVIPETSRSSFKIPPRQQNCVDLLQETPQLASIVAGTSITPNPQRSTVTQLPPLQQQYARDSGLRWGFREDQPTFNRFM